MSQRMESVHIFIWYADKDRTYYDELSHHLGILSQKLSIQIWHEEELLGGDSKAEVMVQLNHAHVILLLLSADFLYSHSHIIQRALERREKEHTKVIPIYLNWIPSGLSELEMLQWLPDNERPISDYENKDEAYVAVIEGLRRVLKEMFSLHELSGSVQSEAKLDLMPSTDPHFVVQRTEVVKDIHARLLRPDVNALVLTGIGGAGKSTLAALVNNYVEEQRQTGVAYFQAMPVWISLYESSTIYDLLTSIAHALNINTVTFSRLALTQQIKEILYAMQSIEQPGLIIIDQFDYLLDLQTGNIKPAYANIEGWLRALNNKPYRTRFLLTSRSMPEAISDMIYIQECPVPAIQIDEGSELLKKRGVEAMENTIVRAYRSCQGHAQSLALLAQLLKKDKSMDLTTLVEDPEGREIWGEQIAQKLLQRVFQQQLSEEQRTLLSALAIYREPVPLRAAQVVLETIEQQSRTTGALYASSQILLAQKLLQDVRNRHYQLHPIVADYARNHVNYAGQTSQQVQQQAHRAAARYYKEVAMNEQQPDGNAKLPENQTRASVEAVWHLCQAGQWQQAYDLLEQQNLFTIMLRQGRSLVLLDLYLSLYQSDWSMNDGERATLSSHIGDLYRTQGDFRQAQPYLTKALQLTEQARANGVTSQVLAKEYLYNWTLNNLGRIHSMRHQYEVALSYFERALAFCREVGNRSDEVTTLNELASVYTAQGNYERALPYHELALAICRELEDKRDAQGKEATALKFLAEASARLEQKKQAQTYYEQALNLQRKLGMRREEGKTLRSLGTFYARISQREKAITHDKEAVAVLHEVGDHFEEGQALYHLGRTYAAGKRSGDALIALKEALTIQRSLNDSLQEGVVLKEIGTVYAQQQAYEPALASFLLAEQALNTAQSSEGTLTRDLSGRIEALRKKTGKKYFTTLQSQVAPDAENILAQALNANGDAR